VRAEVFLGLGSAQRHVRLAEHRQTLLHASTWPTASRSSTNYAGTVLAHGWG
jgi:hypothetical protein